ncbi:MAG: methyltransferase [Alphaproteobacteria bacterium]
MYTDRRRYPGFAASAFAAALMLLLISNGSRAQDAAAGAAAAIASAFHNPDRLAGDSDEDERRKARDVLEFMGVAPGMHVLDYFAGGGFNTELLSRIVGTGGSVIAYYSPAGAARSAEKTATRFAGNRLANAKQLVAGVNDLHLAAGSLDGVLFVMAYHDLYHSPRDAAPPANTGQITASLFQAVKPGGVVVVVDHVANASANTIETVDALHRIDPEVVKNDFTKAGFAFDSESTVLRNTTDDHAKPIMDPSVRYNTDRFVFRFRKPA